MADAVILRLHALLAAEAEALREGAIGELPTLAARKVQLLAQVQERLAQGRLAAGDLARLQRQARTLQPLLEAAIRGTASARSRLATMQRSQTRLDSYDASGRGQMIGGPARRVERKA